MYCNVCMFQGLLHFFMSLFCLLRQKVLFERKKMKIFRNILGLIDYAAGLIDF